MERLTKKLGVDFYVADKAHNTDEVTYRLGKLEDLAEEIGCPLDVRCKVVCNSFIYGILGNQFIVIGIYEDHFTARVHDDYDDYDYDFEWKDYKQTWWLQKDKSE